LIINPSEYARGLFFQRLALLVNSVLGLLMLMRGRWRIPAWNLCVLMLLVPKIWPWWEVINSKVSKFKIGTNTSNTKGKTPIQTYEN